MRKNSIKNTRINGEVQKVLSEIIRTEIKDPRINPMTSVVTVEVAPDLKTCKAYISVLGDEASQQSTMKGLKSAEGYIRRQLAHELNLRNTPQITFILDQSIAYGVNMSKLIDEVTKDISDDEEEDEEVWRSLRKNCRMSPMLPLPDIFIRMVTAFDHVLVSGSS